MLFVRGLYNFYCLLGDAALLTGGPHMLPTSTWKEGIRRRLLDAQGLLKYGVGKLGGLCLSEVTLGVVCQCSSNSR